MLFHSTSSYVIFSANTNLQSPFISADFPTKLGSLLISNLKKNLQGLDQLAVSSYHLRRHHNQKQVANPTTTVFLTQKGIKKNLPVERVTKCKTQENHIYL